MTNFEKKSSRKILNTITKNKIRKKLYILELTAMLCSESTENRTKEYVTCFFFFFVILANFVLVLVGWLNLDSCSSEPMIPIWMMVLGIFGWINVIMTCLIVGYITNEQDKRLNIFLSSFHFLVRLFIVVWFFCGKLTFKLFYINKI